VLEEGHVQLDEIQLHVQGPHTREIMFPNSHRGLVLSHSPRGLLRISN